MSRNDAVNHANNRTTNVNASHNRYISIYYFDIGVILSMIVLAITIIVPILLGAIQPFGYEASCGYQYQYETSHELCGTPPNTHLERKVSSTKKEWKCNEAIIRLICLVIVPYIISLGLAIILAHRRACAKSYTIKRVLVAILLSIVLSVLLPFLTLFIVDSLGYNPVASDFLYYFIMGVAVVEVIVAPIIVDRLVFRRLPKKRL